MQAKTPTSAHASDDFSKLLEVSRLAPQMEGPQPPAVSGHAESASAPPAKKRSFLHDLLLSFCLGGRPQNFLALGAMTVACALPSMIGAIPYLPCFVSPVVFLGVILVSLYVITFYWRTITLTAEDEDDIPLVETNWDIWDDAIQPALRLAAVTVFCLGPAVATQHWYPDATSKPWLIGGLAVLGALLWPIAVMSVALGGSLGYLRPDWLIRAIIGIGPVYLLAVLLLLITLVLWHVAGKLPDPGSYPFPWALCAPLASYGIELYFGYIVFRTLGLFYRHFRQRLPWVIE
jgi:hypothetical protein